MMELFDEGIPIAICVYGATSMSLSVAVFSYLFFFFFCLYCSVTFSFPF